MNPSTPSLPTSGAAVAAARFFRRHGQYVLVLLVALALPLYTLSELIPNDNNIETWLAEDSAARSEYEQFKRDFGVEEFILIGLRDRSPDHPLVAALAARIQTLDTVHEVWDPNRFMGQIAEALTSAMVPEAEARRLAHERIRGLLVSEDGRMCAILALLNERGIGDRSAAVADVRRELETAGLTGDDVHLAGPPVVVAELDYYGSHDANLGFFLITLGICFVIVLYLVRHLGLALVIMLLNTWAINMTLTLVYLIGWKMNFVLIALPPMVMVLTLAICIHVVNYYRWSRHELNPIAHTLRLAFGPCLMCTVTTVIGFGSLLVSHIRPVREFGLAAAIGTGVAMAVGLVGLPAVFAAWPSLAPLHPPSERRQRGFAALADRLRRWRWAVVVGSFALFAVGGYGITRLRAEIDPMAFLPEDNRVTHDYHVLESSLNGLDPIEAVVRFDDPNADVLTAVETVREIEGRLHALLPNSSTFSLADFLPEMDSPLVRATVGFQPLHMMYAVAVEQGAGQYLADDGARWRIEMWIPSTYGVDLDLLNSLEAAVADVPGVSVQFTGIVPLVQEAQEEIFHGLWTSFAMALGVIAALMVVFFRSLVLTFVALVSTVGPIVLVFGTLGWAGIAIDIGTMMTASIALGIAVDATFHLQARYREHRRREGPAESARAALMQCGTAILFTSLGTSLGMMAMLLSPFVPTVRFGWLMASLLMAAVAGVLLLLPALLFLGAGRAPRRAPERATEPVAAPHHLPVGAPQHILGRGR